MTVVVNVLKFIYLKKNHKERMNNFLVLALIATLLIANPSQSDTNHFGAGGVFELDLGDSEIPLTPKKERAHKLLEEQLKSKRSSFY